MNRRSLAVLLGLCVVFAAGSMFAQGAGVRAGVDAKGQLRQPTAEELKQLEALTARFAPRPLTVKVHAATGMASIALDESFDHAYIATTDAHGNVILTCFENHAEANEIVKQTAVADTILRIRPIDRRVAAERE